MSLCEQQWKTDPRGDVIELALTLDSLRQLAHEALESKSQHVSKVTLIDTPFGYPEVELVNPVTRSTVHVIGGAIHDTAIVSHGPDVPVKQVML